MNDAQLLQSFASQNSEPAFRSLVERHLPLVFGTARRMTGDNALAEDIAQTVFILLARKAKQLGVHPVLSGWLYRTTRFVASRALMAEQRRRRREQEAVTMQSTTPDDPAWLQFSPQLDHALARLGETDRNAILLRYFEQQSLREVGVSLGLSEEAAQKRVIRALEKLRRALGRRGAEITIGALTAGLSKESAEAATAMPLAGKISAVVLAHGAAGAGAAGGSALLANVLNAMRWGKILYTTTAVVGLIAVGLVLPSLARPRQKSSSSSTGANAPALAAQKPASLFAALSGKSGKSTHTLLVTVLDSETHAPIPNATLSPYVNGQFVAAFQNPFKTKADGTAKLPIPVNAPGGERGNYCEIPVNAPGYATLVMRWSSATGMVLGLVSSERTVELSHGVTLSGVALDEEGNPLPGLRVGALGSSYGTATVEDYGSFYLAAATSPIVTDASGRFSLEHYPTDARALDLDLLGPDGAVHKFQTPEGVAVHAEVLPRITFAELKSGTARLVIPHGTTVEGFVVNSNDVPIAGAVIEEASRVANLQELSRNRTDAAGRFCLSNRPAHEVILNVSAEGYASLSAIVRIQPGMEPVRLQLPAELPLRGQVVNETGFPVPSAWVSFAEEANPGQYQNWTEQTGADGRFEWQEAPTNEAGLRVTAPGYATKLVRLRASTNEEVITLRVGQNDSLRITGSVLDADSGNPLEHFLVKINHQMMIGGIPQGLPQYFSGSNGESDIRLKRKDFPVGWEEVWMMTVEADGYDTALTRAYELEEGDQQLDFKLKRGGTVRGAIRSPDGNAAAGAQLAFTVSGPVLSAHVGQIERFALTNSADAGGSFILKKPLGASNLVVFHDTGWAVVPITAGAQKANVTLSPWARLDGTATLGGKPAANVAIEVENLKQVYFDPLVLIYHTTSDSEGHFSFDKMPAGIFKLTWRAGKWNSPTLQTAVALAAGESKTETMSSTGRTVAAQLQPPPGLSAINWSNAAATLTADVQIPPEPARNDFITDEANIAAMIRYARDPGVLAALARQKSFAATIGPDGMAVFEQVPPGKYILDVKLFDPSRPPSPPNLDNEPAVVLTRLRAAVTVPGSAGAADDAAPVALGEYALDAL